MEFTFENIFLICFGTQRWKWFHFFNLLRHTYRVFLKKPLSIDIQNSSPEMCLKVFPENSSEKSLSGLLKKFKNYKKLKIVSFKELI